jgi:hypothetical protein
MKQPKCIKCKAKLGLITYQCLCNHVFCKNCKHAEIHDCTYDYKEDGKRKLEQENPKIVSIKIEEI